MTKRHISDMGKVLCSPGVDAGQSRVVAMTVGCIASFPAEEYCTACYAVLRSDHLQIYQDVAARRSRKVMEQRQ